ncbi:MULTISPECIES: hypothetical protein [Variovorax]|jgi:hypothetical protein|uniref:hypothetical protein n=1 Tax=Variovorax TaxID=34072 RepID=UPI001AD5C2DA|nr:MULTISPECIES: hypothetical protein [Variovorax]MBN8755385.1 hypothetical protein [Variovorax sp.]UKI09239.1 hypothetical protein L3V85_05090 [Variovorax paradoxus]
MSFFIEGSWKEWFLRCLWKPPTARGRDALGSNTGPLRFWIRARFQICLRRVGFAPQPRMQALRFVQALARIRPSFFGNSFFFTAPGDDQPPGRQHPSMKLFLNT